MGSIRGTCGDPSAMVLWRRDAMKRVKTLFGFSLLALSMLVMVGCERHSKSETYYLVSNNLKLPYWKTAVEGFQRAASEYNVKAYVSGPQNFDTMAERNSFRDVVENRPAGILISVADADVMGPEIDKAIAAGIPVITMDSDAPDSNRLYFIGTNNLEVGRLGGERLVYKLNGKGNVVFFTNPGQPNLDERLEGYKKAIADHPDIKIVEVFNIKGESGTALDHTLQLLGKKGKDRVDAFVCLEASSGHDVATALKRENVTDRLLIAMDVDPDTLEGIKEGVIDSTISQKPYTMGYFGLRALDEIHHNLPKPLRTDYESDVYSPFPEFVDTGTSLVDKSNVDTFMRGAPQPQKK
jgi:ribose transport system substrate-binding protein